MVSYLLILAAWGNVATTVRHPDAVPLYQCGFENEADEDYDNWPDGWTRQRGTGFPHYLPIEITPEAALAGGRSLRFDLDGAAAAAYSPAIAVDPRHDFVLHVDVCVRQVVHDRAWVSVVFLDEQRKPLETIDSEEFGPTDGWRPVRLGPIRATNSAARWAKVGLHLEPQNQQDLHGTALFDNIWFAQVPRLELQVVEPHLLYEVNRPIDVRCRVSGYKDAPPDVQLELSDSLGGILVRHPLRLERTKVGAEAIPDDREGADSYRVAVGEWTLPISQPGYYRLHAKVSHDNVVLYERELRLAIAELAVRPEQGEFGWTLPGSEQNLSLATLAQWASQAGVHWIKFPLWYDEQDHARVDALTWFADRLNAQGIGLIGLLCEPPPEMRRLLAIAPGSAVANLFTQDPTLWYPSLEPVMARLSLKVRWWQLGYDNDSSLSGVEDPITTIRRVKKQLDEIGQNSHVGVVWNWLDAVPTGKSVPWSFVSRSSEPALAPAELTAYLSANRRNLDQQWLSLDPLDPAQYDSVTRAADLVLRVVAAKEQGVPKIFFNDPLHPQGGLINEDGSASELLLPWRNAALALGGAKYLGRLQLSGGSENRVFVRGHEVIAVIWNSVETDELIDFGEVPRASDVWGRAANIADSPQGRVIKAGPLPLFVVGLNEALVRWRMSITTDRERLPSVSGTPHYLHLTWKNCFDQSAGGTLRIAAPAGWRVSPEAIDLKMGAGETSRQTLELVVPSTASCGREALQFDFDVQAGNRYRFSVRRPIELGLGDVYVELASHLNSQGELEVEQRLVNRTTERVSFRCHLSVPNRRRMRTQVFKLPQGDDVQMYRLPGGTELIGQPLRIQAEEVGGQRRNLNYTFLAEP